MAIMVENLENAFEEMFDFITDLPSGLDGFESDFDLAFKELKELKATLTPQNEPLTLEQVAEILAEQFGDECACNFNGNDEWLPMMCHYGDVCPDPPEHLGCWMELLRSKYCCPPEGEEET